MSENEVKNEKPRSSYPKSVRVIAIVAIALLLLLYLVTLIAGLTTSAATPQLFKACFGASIFVPLMLGGYMTVARLFRNKGGKDDGKEV